LLKFAVPCCTYLLQWLHYFSDDARKAPINAYAELVIYSND